MKKNIKPLSIVLTFLTTTFLFVLIFPSFQSQAGTLGDTYLYLSRIKAGLNGISSVSGTLGVTNNSTAVVGSLTSFTTELSADDILKINDGVTIHTHVIASVTDDTNLVLATDYLGATDTGLSATVENDVGMILAITPSQAFDEAANIEIEILFPMDDSTKWCRSDGALTVTPVLEGPPDITGHEITHALPVKAPGPLAADCTAGDGSSTVDTIKITSVGTLATNTYGVQLSSSTGVLGTSPTSGSRTVTIQVSNTSNLDSRAVSVYLLAEDTVRVVATVSAAPTVTCNLNTDLVDLGALYRGGGLSEVDVNNQIGTSSTVVGYYWAAYGTGDGTNAGLYNSADPYLIQSGTGTGTVDISAGGSEGFGIKLTQPTDATVPANFATGTPGVYGSLGATESGARLILYKNSATSPLQNSTVYYGARAGSTATSGSYQEFITYVCGGYY